MLTRSRIAGIAVFAIALSAPPSARAQSAPVTSELLSEMDFRLIGPAVTGGRIHDLAALPDDPATLYVASASGGLWKTTNHGVTWESLFDDQPVSTFGEVEIAPSNPNIIWVGTGEQNNRQSTSWGNGVYRSLDSGETWTHLGLVETRHIGGLVVHPQNPDVAYVAALGNLWAPSEERGLYRTVDGGQSWEKVLYIDEFTGVVDVVMDPSDPNTLYAAAYQRMRRSWGFNGGGPGSGIYKTTDGGDSWTELTNGIPEGPKGRIGLAIARTNPDRLMALIQHDDSGAQGTYRSENGGESWVRVNELNPRPMYYSQIFIDPSNEDRVYVLGVDSYKSEDGGNTFNRLPSQAGYDVGIHADHHALWIDPSNPDHFYLGGDGGLFVTWDGGLTFDRINNFTLAQYYDIGVDMRDPYWVYGGLQDNHSFMGPSETRHWLGILNRDWKQIGFGDGVWHGVDPTSARFVYSSRQGGDLVRVDAFTGDRLGIEPPEGPEEDFRFDWNTPGVVSAHDPATVYYGGNHLFITHDRGETWERTEDLTRQIDRDTLEIMGVDGAAIQLSTNDGVSSYGEITAIAESPLTPSVLWVGADDGTLQLSRDAGESWTNVTDNVPGMPPLSFVRSIAASSASPGTAYVAFDLHWRGDFSPYLFRTEDYGATWTAIHGGLPDDGSVNIVVEHPDRPGLIFAGTEHGLFVSSDSGGQWAKFSNIPTTLMDDLVIHPREKDLVVGTHGRGIWILDDVTALAEWTPGVASSTAHIFSPVAAKIYWFWKDTSYMGQSVFMGENPAFGALLSYYLAEPAQAPTITIRNDEGELVRELQVPGEPGVIHRVNWDLRWTVAFPEDYQDDSEGFQSDEPRPLPVYPRSTGPFGAFVSPGSYTVTLTANGATSTTTLEVEGDPEMPMTLAQYEAREDFLLDLRNIMRQATERAEAAEAAGDEALAEVFDNIADDADDLAGKYNGGGVQQPSLYPPIQSDIRAKVELEAALNRMQ